MKDKTLKRLFKLKPVAQVMSLLDKNGAVSMTGPVSHLAKNVVESGYNVSNDTFKICIPSPHKLLMVDKLKWFGLLPLLLEKDFSVEIHVPCLEVSDDIDSHYKKAISKLSSVTIIEHEAMPTDEEFDYILFFHNDLNAQSIDDIKQISYKQSLLMFWSEMDWLINSKYVETYNIKLTEPGISDFTVASGVEDGSGWCLVSSTIESIDREQGVEAKHVAESRFLKAMYNHSSHLGYTNPRTRPGNSIRDMRINNILRPEMIYVIDNLVLDNATGILYEYKRNRDTMMSAEVNILNHPPESKSFIDNLIWAYLIKAIYHIKPCEKAPVNNEMYAAIESYAEFCDTPEIKSLLKANLLESQGRKEEALRIYIEQIVLGSAEITYRAGALSINEDRMASKHLFEMSAKLGSSIAAYNYGAMIIEDGLKTKTQLESCLQSLTQSAKNGFEPAQSALAELSLQTGNTQEGIKWLKKSSTNGNIDSACNLVVVLEDLYEKGQCEKFELRKAQKNLKEYERKKRAGLNRTTKNSSK